MSHFSILVVTPTNPADSNIVQETLQPYHEFECTGVVDSYVKNIIRTEKILASYETDTKCQYRSPEGHMFDPYDPQFYRDPTQEEQEIMGHGFHGSGFGRGLSWESRDWGDGKGYRAQIQHMPEGYTEVQIPVRDIMTITEFIDYSYGTPRLDLNAEPDLENIHKWGWYRIDNDGHLVEYVRRTNPNSKWDFWTVGGRWENQLIQKDGSVTNSACKSDLDLKAMVNKARKDRMKILNDAIINVAGDDSQTSRTEILNLHAAAAAVWDSTIKEWQDKNSDMNLWAFIRTMDSNHPLRKIDDFHLWDDWGWGFPPATRNMTDPFQWVENVPALPVFGILKDGVWHERGEMGWWGCVSNEQNNWESKINELLNSIPDNHWLTVVDCHI